MKSSIHALILSSHRAVNVMWAGTFLGPQQAILPLLACHSSYKKTPKQLGIKHFLREDEGISSHYHSSSPCLPQTWDLTQALLAAIMVNLQPSFSKTLSLDSMQKANCMLTFCGYKLQTLRLNRRYNGYQLGTVSNFF